MQIPCGVHPEVPAEGAESGNPAGVGGGIPQFGEQWEGKVEEGHGPVHRLLSVPLKYSASNVMGFIKGKNAIHIARVDAGRRRNFVGQHFGARGYWVSTVGKNEAAVRQ